MLLNLKFVHPNNTLSEQTRQLIMLIFAVPVLMSWLILFFNWGIIVIIIDERFPVTNVSTSFCCANTRIHKNTSLGYVHPYHREAFMWLRTSVWLLMCAHRPRNWADYESADSPHFLPSDLLEGLCWADCWTTTVRGGGLAKQWDAHWSQSSCPHTGRVL